MIDQIKVDKTLNYDFIARCARKKEEGVSVFRACPKN
jgi:hypothetical protein